jgi:hypothetical protein
METQKLDKIASQLEGMKRQIQMMIETVNAMAAAERGGGKDGPREGREVSLSIKGREYKI